MDLLDRIDSLLKVIAFARKKIAKQGLDRVRKSEDIDYLRSVAYTWIKTHRPEFLSHVGNEAISSVDHNFQALLDATSRATSRSFYISTLREANDALMNLRVPVIAQQPATKPITASSPDFSPLAGDLEMRDILGRRWHECQKCISGGAHLAATVMMGGLLEALFVARANKMTDKNPLFRAKSTPIDGKTKKPLPLPDWTLRPYIDVGHELGWITRSGKDVATVLRDYRNYIHPEKERAHAVSLSSADSDMFWQLTQALTQQLLNSAAKSP